MEKRSSTPNATLNQRARQSLSGHWSSAIAASAILLAFDLIVTYLIYIPFLGGLLMILCQAPMQLGLARYMLAMARGEVLPAREILYGFQTLQRGWLAIRTYFLMQIFICLWSLLLFIPGLVAMLSYAMTMFLLVDQPELGAREALRQSKAMMRGNKWKYFCLECRFFGWELLCMLPVGFAVARVGAFMSVQQLTLFLLPIMQLSGLGFLWLLPYWRTAEAHFYQDILNQPATPYAEVQEEQPASEVLAG